MFYKQTPKHIKHKSTHSLPHPLPISLKTHFTVLPEVISESLRWEKIINRSKSNNFVAFKSCYFLFYSFACAFLSRKQIVLLLFSSYKWVIHKIYDNTFYIKKKNTRKQHTTNCIVLVIIDFLLLYFTVHPWYT